jgi:superfamily II DNA helicase RecQ
LRHNSAWAESASCKASAAKTSPSKWWKWLPAVEELLEDPERRPAIVYAPSRKETEALAAELNQKFPSAAYHAGLDAKRRQKVQEAFQGGKLEVIAATIAFGMGIDKPNIRTVVHTSTPGSIESYYQEIGRAGRDGNPSRAILMQSYADRRTHDYFFDRNYPEPGVLDLIYRKLPDSPIDRDELAHKFPMDEEIFAGALEKLWIHAGVIVESNDTVRRGSSNWRDSYSVQRDQKMAQLEQMLRFADCGTCRMSALVAHFGDRSDSRRACGICDFCAPSDALAAQFRAPNGLEAAVAGSALQILSQVDSMSTGRLHTQAGSAAVDRNTFERILAGLARSGYVELNQESFEKDGRSIPYKSVTLTNKGYENQRNPEFLLDESIENEYKNPRQAAAARRLQTKKKLTRESKKVAAAKDPSGPLVEALKQWRLAEAKKAGIPAFRILTDKALQSIAEDLPANDEELNEVKGVSARIVKQHGAAILKIVGKHSH